MKKFIFLGAAILLGAASFVSCSKDDDNAGTTRMQVYLTDDPAAFDAVYIDIKDVQVKYSTEESESGWQSLNLGRAGIYNLLDFRNGYDTLLAVATVPAGRINQIRLLLGTNNSVVLNGISYPLTTPSGQQSGVKLNIHADLISDIDYRLWIDFDASRSIVLTGNGKYILKPVIRTYVDAITGGIKGTVSPVNSTAFVYVVRNTVDTIGSAMPDALGRFMVRGIDAGSYTVLYQGINNYRDTSKANVTVATGSVTDVGTQTLTQ